MMITYIAAPSPQTNIRRGRRLLATSSGHSPSRQSVRSDRLPADPHAAGSMLQDVRQGRPKVELAETLLVADAHHHEVDPTLQNLVDDGRADVTGLKQVGVHAQPEPFSDLLGLVEQILTALGLVLKLGVERERSLHLDNVNDEHLGLRGSGRFAGKLKNLVVGDISFDR